MKFVLCICVIAMFILYLVYNLSKRCGYDSDSFSAIDIVYYINLDHRTDRNGEFLREMDKAGIPKEKIHRVSGVYDKERGLLGCAKSHIKVLEDFIQKGYSKCIIFEDDFELVGDPSVIKSLTMPFDVIMLSANEYNVQDSQYPGLKKVLDAQTTSGYMLSKEFAPTLLQNFKEGAPLIEASYNGKKYEARYAIDQYWKKLQPDSKWYMCSPKIGKQRKSFSDIQEGVVDYNV